MEERTHNVHSPATGDGLSPATPPQPAGERPANTGTNTERDMEIEIEITAADMAAGRRGTSRGCPLAMAAQRAMTPVIAPCTANVHPQRRLAENARGRHAARNSLALAPKVRTWIKKWNDGMTQRPLRMRVNAEDTLDSAAGRGPAQACPPHRATGPPHTSTERRTERHNVCGNPATASPAAPQPPQIHRPPVRTPLLQQMPRTHL